MSLFSIGRVHQHHYYKPADQQLRFQLVWAMSRSSRVQIKSVGGTISDIPKGWKWLVDASCLLQSFAFCTRSSLPDDFKDTKSETYWRTCTVLHVTSCAKYKQPSISRYYLSEPARSTRFKRPKRKLIISSHSHCNYPQKGDKLWSSPSNVVECQVIWTCTKNTLNLAQGKCQTDPWKRSNECAHLAFDDTSKYTMWATALLVHVCSSNSSVSGTLKNTQRGQMYIH